MTSFARDLWALQFDHLARVASRPAPTTPDLAELALQRDLIAVALWQTVKAMNPQETRLFAELSFRQQAFWREQAEQAQTQAVGR